MKKTFLVFGAGAAVGVFLALAAGCLSSKKGGPIIREPDRPGESTLEYEPPGPPQIPSEMVTNYLPMIRRMISPTVKEVADDVFLAMGYGLGNVIVIVTDEGLVALDSSDSQQVASEIMRDMRKQRKIGDKPVKYLIYTHFHPDHTNGSRSICQEGTEVIAAEEFLYWIDYQNRFLAEHHQRARTNQSGGAAPDYAFEIPLLGQSPVRIDRDKAPDVVMPTITFKEKYAFTCGGKKFELYHAPGETEDHLIVWMPEERIVFPADLYYHSFPNLSTPMLESRPVRGWINSLEKIMALRPRLMVPHHTWPIEGEDEVMEHLTNYRDAVKLVHDETVRCINEGKTVDEAVKEVALPERLASLPYLKENYGRVEWSVRGIYHGYKGWYDGTGSTLYPLPPEYAARELIELSGGANHVLKRAIELQRQGEHQLCMELCDVVIKANPRDSLAHRVKAESLHQNAYVYANLNTFGFFRSAYSLEMKAAEEGEKVSRLD